MRGYFSRKHQIMNFVSMTCIIALYTVYLCITTKRFTCRYTDEPPAISICTKTKAGNEACQFENAAWANRRCSINAVTCLDPREFFRFEMLAGSKTDAFPRCENDTCVNPLVRELSHRNFAVATWNLWKSVKLYRILLTEGKYFWPHPFILHLTHSSANS